MLILYVTLNSAIGTLFLVGAGAAAYSLYRVGENGLSLATTLVALEVGVALWTATLIMLGLTQLLPAAIAGQIHMLISIAFFVWKLTYDNHAEKIQQALEDDNSGGQPGRGGIPGGEGG